MASRAAAHHEAAHRPLWLRVLWFVLVGWWLTLFTLVLAYLCLLTIIGLPAAFWLFDRVPLVLTLKPRSEWSADERVIGIQVGIVMLNVLPSVVTLQRN